MITPAFSGLWTYPSALKPTFHDFMFIDKSRHRIITFMVMSDNPLYYGPMRNWYEPASSTSISTRLSLDSPWREIPFDLDGNCLSWTYGGKVHPWQRVPWADRPDWLDEKIVVAHSKMDAAEEASGWSVESPRSTPV